MANGGRISDCGFLIAAGLHFRNPKSPIRNFFRRCWCFQQQRSRISESVNSRISDGGFLIAAGQHFRNQKSLIRNHLSAQKGKPAKINEPIA
jgi:hypothetical protein